MLIEILLILTGVLSIISLVIFGKIIDVKRRKQCMDKFTNYQGILEYFMEKAFEIIYKDQVLIYSLEGTKPKESAIDAMSQDFVRLTQKFIGPMMLDEFVFMYGGTEAFTFNLVNYFSLRYEDDEIRNSTLANIAEDEEI